MVARREPETVLAPLKLQIDHSPANEFVTFTINDLSETMPTIVGTVERELWEADSQLREALIATYHQMLARMVVVLMSGER